MPYGVDLVLHEREDPAAVRLDGERLGEVLVDAARRFRTPLACPLMDLTLEKCQLLTWLGVEAAEIPQFHFSSCPGEEAFAALEAGMAGPLIPALQAHVDAARHVASEEDLLAMGMVIGPFSLMTKLLADPITAVYLGGMGMTADMAPEVAMLDAALELGTRVILHSLKAQVAAGAKAIVVCEPAANVVYLSPRQIADGADVFERYVLTPNRRLKAALDDAGAALVLHDCGELTDEMVRELASLEPVIFSLGGSRRLWEDAALVPDDVVLFGNLPSKKFFSDNEITCEQVVAEAQDLARKMCETGHPFILGTECDVLSVPGCEKVIGAKVAAFMDCEVS